VPNATHPFDDTDALAADVCSSVKRRGDHFEGADQLCSWLDEDGVRWTSDSLTAIEVQAATWSPGGQLDWWLKERQEWWGRVRGADGRQRWIRAVDLRPAKWGR
jgi:hypothetical protein